jgi:hypothetical protein
VGDFAGANEVVGSLRVRGIVGVAIFEGGKVEDEMVLDHSHQAMV